MERPIEEGLLTGKIKKGEIMEKKKRCLENCEHCLSEIKLNIKSMHHTNVGISSLSSSQREHLEGVSWSVVVKIRFFREYTVIPAMHKCIKNNKQALFHIDFQAWGVTSEATKGLSF